MRRGTSPKNWHFLTQLQHRAASGYVSTRTFVSGHSYGETAFSTETIIRHNGLNLGNLEEWKAYVDERTLLAAGRNFWGVTSAADGDTFSVAGAVGQTTWLTKGSISKRTKCVMYRRRMPLAVARRDQDRQKKRLGNPTPG